MLPTRRTVVGLGAAAMVLALTAIGAPAASAQTTSQTVVPSATAPNISTTAGTGQAAFGGDGGPATKAKLNLPTGVAEDAAGNLYIADTLNFRIRKVTTAGIISTIAGTGSPGFSGDGGLAVNAKLASPESPAVDSSGDVYFADSGNNRVREILANGKIKTIAGNGTCGSSGDGGKATLAELCDPTAVAIAAGGRIYIADTGNNKIRAVEAGGIISTYAGTGTFGSAGDGGAATSAELGSPSGIAISSLGDLFIADTSNNKIREVKPSGKISTFAGTGSGAFAGDGGLATAAKIDHPEGVGVDALGNVYIADSFNFRIRVVIPKGDIFTYAGTGIAGFSGDGGPATNARINVVSGDLAVDANDVYFTDTVNMRVRRIQGGPPPNIAESPYAILLPLSALVLMVGAYLLLRRRSKRRMGAPTDS